jgi:hypothetical protein
MLLVQKSKLMLIILMLWFSLPIQAQEQTNLAQRADAARYLGFLNDEQQELNFQLQHGEVTRNYYQRATDRLNILKALISSYGRSNNPGPLPEYHVVPISELNGLIPDGRNRLKRSRSGEVIDQRWRFLKVISRSEIFYVLERLNETERGTNP